MAPTQMELAKSRKMLKFRCFDDPLCAVTVHLKMGNVSSAHHHSITVSVAARAAAVTTERLKHKLASLERDQDPVPDLAPVLSKVGVPCFILEAAALITDGCSEASEMGNRAGCDFKLAPSTGATGMGPTPTLVSSPISLSMLVP